MCGFIGYISKKNSPRNKKTEIKFKKYFNFLSNRGPDFKEEKKILNFDNLIHVGFSRLAIQDVSSKSNKIFHNKDKMILGQKVVCIEESRIVKNSNRIIICFLVYKYYLT